VATVFALFLFAGGALASAQTERALFVFNGASDGYSPHAGLVADSSGALYGTTAWGGNTASGDYGGVVFKLSPPAAPGSPWVESVLYKFQGGDFSRDGANPYCTLVFDSAGNLYGTTEDGGQYEAGTIFQLVPPAAPGGAWTENLLYSGQDAYYLTGLAIDGSGALYGAGFYGEVFQLVPPTEPGGAWTYNALADMGNMTGNLILDSKGNLYGTTQDSGRHNAGLVFALKPPAAPGDPWTQVDLYSFTGGSDGKTPVSNLTLKGGVLYGTTQNGGSLNLGTVYSVTPPSAPGSPWTEAVLYSFQRGSDGEGPVGGVAFGNKGVIYGTTSYGGSDNFGTVYSLTPPSAPGDSWIETTLHSFTGKGNDGDVPDGTLLLLHGAFFGTTAGGYGTLFEVSQ
jgi:uncharacterized repeat protein (TIGR03803 family)